MRDRLLSNFELTQCKWPCRLLKKLFAKALGAHILVSQSFDAYQSSLRQD